jgi:hypothetical protein
MKLSNFIIVLILCALQTSCGSEEENPLDVDVSDIKVEQQYNAIFKELKAAAADTAQSNHVLKDLQKKYPDFSSLYFSEILKLGHPGDPVMTEYFKMMLTDTLTLLSLRNIEENFKNTKDIENQISDAFKHLKYYYPDAVVPDVFFAYNAFNYGAFPGDRLLIIGLEMYLGDKNKLIETIPLYDFIKKRMQPEYLVIDAMRAWFEFHLMPDSKAQDFLGHIIEEGKMMYVLNALMPDREPNILMRYNKEEWQWCLSNEENIWKELVDKNLLYSKDELNISKFLNEAPFTAGLPKESPPRVGQFIGWAIVRDFMQKNSEITLKQLLENYNYQAILSAYRPGAE